MSVDRGPSAAGVTTGAGRVTLPVDEVGVRRLRGGRDRRRCTGAVTLHSVDRSISLHVSLLESGHERAPRLRVTTADGTLLVVGLFAGAGEPATVDLEVATLTTGRVGTP